MAPVKAYKSSLSQIELVTTYELLSALILEFVPILKFASLEKYYREDTFYRIIELFSTRFGFKFFYQKALLNSNQKDFIRYHCFGIDDIIDSVKYDKMLICKIQKDIQSKNWSCDNIKSFYSFYILEISIISILQILFRTEFPR